MPHGILNVRLGESSSLLGQAVAAAIAAGSVGVLSRHGVTPWCTNAARWVQAVTVTAACGDLRKSGQGRATDGCHAPLEAADDSTPNHGMELTGAPRRACMLQAQAARRQLIPRRSAAWRLPAVGNVERAVVEALVRGIAGGAPFVTEDDLAAAARAAGGAGRAAEYAVARLVRRGLLASQWDGTQRVGYRPTAKAYEELGASGAPER